MEHSDHSAHHPKKQSEQWYSKPRFCWENINFIYKLLFFDQENFVNSQSTRIWFFKTSLCCEIQVVPSSAFPRWVSVHQIKILLLFQALAHPLTPKAHISEMCEDVSVGRAGTAWFSLSFLCQLLLAPPIKIKTFPYLHCSWYFPKEQKSLKIFNKTTVKSTIQRRIWNRNPKQSRCSSKNPLHWLFWLMCCRIKSFKAKCFMAPPKNKSVSF